MGKIIWAINATIDGYADHTAVIADEELHDFFTNILKNVDTMLFGRKTYQLMEDFWPNAGEDSESTEDMIRFADQINNMPKIVFSRTLRTVNWNNTTIIKENMIEEIARLKKSGKVLSIGGISIASALLKENMIDEFWFVIHPIISGKGIRLVEEMISPVNLKFINSRPLGSGAVVMHYEK